jgi:hypothetical protein
VDWGWKEGGYAGEGGGGDPAQLQLEGYSSDYANATGATADGGVGAAATADEWADWTEYYDEESQRVRCGSARVAVW